jgi:putative salt-induced outer membrane protein
LWLVASPGCPERASGQATLIHLRNGDRLSGNLVVEEPGSITISNPILGRLVLPLAQVQRREFITNTIATSAPPAVPTNGSGAPKSLAIAPVFQAKLTELQTIYLSGRLSAEEYQRERAKVLAEAAAESPVAVPGTHLPPPAGATPVSIAKASAVAPPKPAPTKFWSGEAFMGTDLAFGQKNRELYSGRLKVNYVQAPVRNNLDYLFTYGRTEGELTANRMDGSMKTDVDLARRTYAYSLGAAGYDEIRKIDWRYELGPGAGYQLLKLTNFLLRVESGFHYQVQNFEGDRQDEAYYHRFAQDIKWTLGPQFSFDEKAEYMPELEDLHMYKFRMEANVRYWLNSNLSLNFTVINLYDTVTAPGVGQNDLQLRSSIGMKF